MIGFDLGEPMAVEGERAGEVRLDVSSRQFVPTQAPALGVVERHFTKQSIAARRRARCRSTCRGRATGWCTPTHRPTARSRWQPVVPSTTYVRCRSSILAISFTSVIGSASIQWATNGYDLTTFSQHSTSSMLRSRGILGAGDDADAPRAVVGRQRQDRDRTVRLQQSAEGRRYRSVGRTEVAAVVDEAAVLDHLLSGRANPRRAARSASTIGVHRNRRRGRP